MAPHRGSEILSEIVDTTVQCFDAGAHGLQQIAVGTGVFYWQSLCSVFAVRTVSTLSDWPWGAPLASFTPTTQFPHRTRAVRRLSIPHGALRNRARQPASVLRFKRAERPARRAARLCLDRLQGCRDRQLCGEVYFSAPSSTTSLLWCEGASCLPANASEYRPLTLVKTTREKVFFKSPEPLLLAVGKPFSLLARNAVGTDTQAKVVFTAKGQQPPPVVPGTTGLQLASDVYLFPFEPGRRRALRPGSGRTILAPRPMRLRSRHRPGARRSSPRAAAASFRRSATTTRADNRTSSSSTKITAPAASICI